MSHNWRVSPVDRDDIQAAPREVARRCIERFGSSTRFDAPLATWRVNRVKKLQDVPIQGLGIDDQIDREILITQRIRAALKHVAWYAKRAAGALVDGDEWAYWRSLLWDALIWRDLMLRAIESGDELPVLEATQYMFSQPAAPDVEPTVENLVAYWRGLDPLKVQT